MRSRIAEGVLPGCFTEDAMMSGFVTVLNSCTAYRLGACITQRGRAAWRSCAVHFSVKIG